MRYLRMSRIWAENSYCVRRKVGALIVKDKMIISDGYNGTPSGFENICEDETGHTKAYVLHAEANAITKVAKSANNCDGSTLYITAAPLHRVLETHHPGGHQARGLLGGVSLRGGARPAAPRRHRVRAVHPGRGEVRRAAQRRTIRRTSGTPRETIITKRSLCRLLFSCRGQTRRPCGRGMRGDRRGDRAGRQMRGPCEETDTQPATHRDGAEKGDRSGGAATGKRERICIFR